MASARTLLYYGALLHDIGKVLFRGSSQDVSHQELGADFIERELAALNERFAGSDGRAITEQIRYHHIEDLMSSGLPGESLAYITCFANTISSGAHSADERLCDMEAVPDRGANLRKIFNMLNGHCDDHQIEHPSYDAIASELRDRLSDMDVSADSLNALIDLLDATTDTIPTCTSVEGLLDVPFSDHARTTAGIAACVFEYLSEQGVSDYRDALFGDEPANQRSTDMFLLYSCDISGIQDFIYNISGSGALKQLRARSMYLELLLEHIVDELLERLGLCRANLIYTGGGHAYMLLPNTQATVAALEEFSSELNAWFVDRYRTDLFMACAWVMCSADDLANEGANKRRYPQLFQRLTRGLSEAKASRYSARTIRELNFGHHEFDHSRECSECHRSDLRIDDEGKCELCASLGAISRNLATRDVFVVEREGVRDGEGRRACLPLPFGCTLRMYSLEGYLNLQAKSRQVYAKERVRLPDHNVIRIMMGDYVAEVAENDVSSYASEAMTLKSEDGEHRGIQRLGVLRADVDDLGATFAFGLPDSRACIARTATLSRALSRFFKREINDVLQHANYQVQIIYSGGDDLFLVGNWSDVIYAAIDVRRAFTGYTGNGSVTISAGIGMFDKTYPIARMASETGELEDAAKGHHAEGVHGPKDAVALWTEKAVFPWDEFVGVVEPRMRWLGNLFENNEKGSAFAYQLVALLRNYDDVASAPRLAYLLARAFEDDSERGGAASKDLYALAQDDKERRRLLAALEWHIYSNRGERS